MSPARNNTKSRRRGLTLAELLIATTIMVLIAGAMAMLSTAVHSANDHCRGQLELAQHARIALARIERALHTALANEQFPGCLVVSEPISGQDLPQTLVVWSPEVATDPGGRRPLVSEIVVFAPSPTQPGTLWEIRSPSDGSTVPYATDASGWRTLTDSLKTSASTSKIVLTDRLRTAPLSGSWTSSLAASSLRGVVRFRRLMAPSEVEWSQYRASTKAWQDLSWPLDSYRAGSGTRTVVCQTELQLVSGTMGSAAVTAAPFFGSVALAYELPR